MDFKEIQKDPNKIGFPTFEQFKKSPDKWLGKETDVFDQVANGSQNQGIRNATKEIKYEILHYKTNKIEEVERIARENGLDLRKLKYKAVIQNMGGHFGEQVVRFMSEDELNRRDKW